MKILLVGVNSKFIHTNLAIYYLKDYADKYMNDDERKNTKIEIAEYTINNEESQVIGDIYDKHADVICFSTYIWNVTYVKNVISSLSKITDATICVGGPEVSFESEAFLKDSQGTSVVMRLEGEETFLDLIKVFNNEMKLEDVKGITYRDKSGDMKSNPDRLPVDMNNLVFTYNDVRLEECKNKIIYYESSRGCPFRCSYCMSSIDKTVRYKDLDIVFKELKYLIDEKVPQVKFVDRTFNCDKKRTMAIWQFLKDNDNGITNFHFELAIEIFDEEMAKLLNSLRRGQVQVEIGVQTTNQTTLHEIDRHNDMEKIKNHVAMIQRGENIHVHLDLIAGLPYEDYASFRKSFNEVYSMRPSCLQLGFLKVLKGTKMHDKKEEYGLKYKDTPPYEVLSTKWISFDDIKKLKDIEGLLDAYYNSERNYLSLKYLEKEFETPFDMYEEMSKFWRASKYYEVKHSMAGMLEILYEFGVKSGCDPDILENIMRYELYSHERPSKEPSFMMIAMNENEEFKEKIKEYYKERKSEISKKYLFDHYDIDVEALSKNGEIIPKQMDVLFEYKENISKLKEREDICITYNI